MKSGFHISEGENKTVRGSRRPLASWHGSGATGAWSGVEEGERRRQQGLTQESGCLQADLTACPRSLEPAWLDRQEPPVCRALLKHVRALGQATDSQFASLLSSVKGEGLDKKPLKATPLPHVPLGFPAYTHWEARPEAPTQGTAELHRELCLVSPFVCFPPGPRQPPRRLSEVAGIHLLKSDLHGQAGNMCQKVTYSGVSAAGSGKREREREREF